MIHFTKKFYAMIFAICSMSQIMHSNDMREEAGRTELMNYVIAAEKEIEYKKSELEKLWSTYFNVEINSINTMPINGAGMVFYDFKTVRKAYTTEADVEHYKKVQDEYNSFIKDIHENIKSMVLDGANLQARDVNGKSVSDYCSSWEMYNILRELGAPITLNQQFLESIISGTIVTSSVVVIGIVTSFIATVCYKACFPR